MTWKEISDPPKNRGDLAQVINAPKRVFLKWIFLVSHSLTSGVNVFQNKTHNWNRCVYNVRSVEETEWCCSENRVISFFFVFFSTHVQCNLLFFIFWKTQKYIILVGKLPFSKVNKLCFAKLPLKRTSKPWKNMKKVILFKVPPTRSFVKIIKLLISLKMPLKFTWKLRRNNVNNRLVVRMPRTQA